MKFIFLAMNLFVAIALPKVGLEGVFVFFIRSEINDSVRSDLILACVQPSLPSPPLKKIGKEGGAAVHRLT